MGCNIYYLPTSLKKWQGRKIRDAFEMDTLNGEKEKIDKKWTEMKIIVVGLCGWCSFEI